MTQFNPIRNLPLQVNFSKDDSLVLFGELMPGGYANGLVSEAKRLGLNIIYTTTGRRDKDESLRPLLQEELHRTDGTFINIPLEAGFDFEKYKNIGPLDSLNGLKLSEWQNARINWDVVESCKEQGRERLRLNTKKFVAELKKHIKPNSKIIFAHLMAGGVPRTKIILPLINRVLKGTGERHLSSQDFWQSELGKLCSHSFDEVTAESFKILFEETQILATDSQYKTSQFFYLAYGYHGTEVLINDKIQWQTYSPYLQGWAKIKLENYAATLSSSSKCCVYNCPEILTSSSAIFSGVDLSLSTLLKLLLNSKNITTKNIALKIQDLLSDSENLNCIYDITNKYYQSPVLQEYSHYENWPMHNSKDQMELMLTTSEKIISMHKSNKDIIQTPLSALVLQECGKIMLHDIINCKTSASWIGHDLIEKSLSQHF